MPIVERNSELHRGRQQIATLCQIQEKKMLDRRSNDKSSRGVQEGKAYDWENSQKYEVPKMTLHDRISGRVKHGTKPDPQPYLKVNEEEVLVDHLIKVAKVGMEKLTKSGQKKFTTDNLVKKSKSL